MLDPYENILIGNFLYILGAKIGAKCAREGSEIAGSMCLLQQTPADKFVGDVFARYPRAMRIYEFKRQSNRDTKEAAKLIALQASLQTAYKPSLEPLSKAVHWYVVSKKADPTWIVTSRPYLEMKAEAPSRELDLSQLADDLVRAAFSSDAPEFPEAAIKAYLKAIATYAGEGTATSSGMMVIIGSDGVVRWLPLQDFRDLQQTLVQLDERTQAQAREIEMSRTVAEAQAERRVASPEVSRSKKNERDRGHGIGD